MVFSDERFARAVKESENYRLLDEGGLIPVQKIADTDVYDLHSEFRKVPENCFTIKINNDGEGQMMVRSNRLYKLINPVPSFKFVQVETIEEVGIVDPLPMKNLY